MACKAGVEGSQKNRPEELEKVARAVMSGQVDPAHGRPGSHRADEPAGKAVQTGLRERPGRKTCLGDKIRR